MQEFTLRERPATSWWSRRHQAPRVQLHDRRSTRARRTIRSARPGLAHMMEHMAFKGNAVIGTTGLREEKPLTRRAEEKAWNAAARRAAHGARHARHRRCTARGGVRRSARASAREPVVVSNDFSKVDRAGGRARTSKRLHGRRHHGLLLFDAVEPARAVGAARRAAAWRTRCSARFYKERDVVYEERRMRYESSPLRPLHSSSSPTPRSPPTRTASAASASRRTSTSFSRTEGEEFFREPLRAKNMVVAVARRRRHRERRCSDTREQYFGDLSHAPKPPPLDTVEPEPQRRAARQGSSRTSRSSHHRLARARRVGPALPGVRGARPICSAGGDFARLIKTLVKEKKIAAQRAAPAPGSRARSTRTCSALLRDRRPRGQDPARRSSRRIYAALDGGQRRQPFTAEEVDGLQGARQARRRSARPRRNDDLASRAGAGADAARRLARVLPQSRSARRRSTLADVDRRDGKRRSCEQPHGQDHRASQTASDAQEGGR